MQQTTHNPLPRPAARRGGFTLIELLVVIGIIVLLVSLVLAVAGSVIRSSEERATRNTLEVLNAATEEFERVLDLRISYQSGVVASGIAADPAPSATAVYDILSSYAVATSIPPGSPGNGVTGWTQLSQPYSTRGAFFLLISGRIQVVARDR